MPRARRRAQPATEGSRRALVARPAYAEGHGAALPAALRTGVVPETPYMNMSRCDRRAAFCFNRGSYHRLFGAAL